MADPAPCEPSSRGDPLKNLDTVLTDLTQDLIPGYIAQIQGANPSDLEVTMASLIATALTTELTALTKMSGHIANVMYAQLKQSCDLLEQATTKTHKEENKVLQQRLGETNNLWLTQSSTSMN